MPVYYVEQLLVSGIRYEGGQEMNSEFNNSIVLATNLIRFIGDKISTSNKIIPLLEVLEADECSGIEMDINKIIGSSNSILTKAVFDELLDRNIIIAQKITSFSFHNINLTFDGWALYEAEKKGQIGGNYGFVAMQFNDHFLDQFVKNVVKPAVKEGTGYDLKEMRDPDDLRAGVIDNIMRVNIRGAAFVIADLTHDNSGAYWEAGYAEGLGKPVIYICEKKTFDTRRGGTHFDTNHCTTLFWSKDDDSDSFCKDLIATIRNSLESKADPHFSWPSKNPPLHGRR